MEPTFFIITVICIERAIISNICIQHLFSFGRIPPPATSTIHNAYCWNDAHHLHQSHRQLASGRYVRGSAIAPVPASPFITPHQNWLLNKSQSTAIRFSGKWRSSHQAPPSACAIPRMKVSGKSKLSSPHLNSRQLPKIENTLAQKTFHFPLSTFNFPNPIKVFQQFQSLVLLASSDLR